MIRGMASVGHITFSGEHHHIRFVRYYHLWSASKNAIRVRNGSALIIQIIQTKLPPQLHTSVLSKLKALASLKTLYSIAC